MVDILWKSVVGGLVTGLIAWAARRGNVLPGILPLFPTFAIIGLFLVGIRGDSEAFRQTAAAGMKTLPAYLAFLVTCYLGVRRLDFRWSLLVGIGAWLAVVALLFMWDRR